MTKQLRYLCTLLLCMIASVGWADTTYKLEQVTSVEKGGLYVFEQSGHVAINTVSNSALQTTSTYNTTKLTGTENYVWELKNGTKGYIISSKANASTIIANSSGTNISLNATGSDWTFSFQDDGTVLIQNPNNDNRFLGYSGETNYQYKAYAASNLPSYPHAIVVYKLVEETGEEPETIETPTFSPEAGTYSSIQNVTISCTTTDATIYYTTDGSVPTVESIIYNGAIEIGFGSTTIKAFAVKNGMTNSAVAEASYVIKADYATLPFSWEGGTSSDFTVLAGVSASGLGSDYASGNAPYLIKFDTTGDYILIKTDGQPGKVSIDVKMLGGAAASSIKVQGSSDGTSFTDIETLSISGKQNDVLTLETTKDFAATDRYVKLVFTKGSNVGVGPITIAKPKAVKDPTFSLASGTYTGTQSLSITCETEGAAIKYSFDLDNWTDYSGAINIASSTTIYAKAIKGTDESNIVSKSYTIIDPNAPGSANNPYTVAQAIENTPASGNSEEVYVKGIVCQVDNFNSNYKSITYWISADGNNDGDRVEVYSGKGIDGADFSSIEDIKVGDIVVVKGTLKKYNDITEFNYNNQLISHVRNTLSAPSFSFAAGTYKEALSVEITCATEDAAIYYSFDNESWTLYEKPITICESKTLYAKAVKDDKEEIASAEYIILIDRPIEGYKYVKVTSTEDITDGQYLIVYEDETNSVAFDGGLETLDAASNTIDVTISENEIAATTFKQAAEFTIDVTNGTLKSTSGKYIGVTSYSNGLASSDEAIANTISIDESGNANIVVNTTGGNMFLKFNKASNQERFRYYKSGQEAIQLYKLVKIVPPAAPTFSPAAGEVEKGTEVTITAEKGATLKYTVGETTTTTESNTATVTVNEDVTIKAVAVKDGVESEEVSAAYTVKAEEPVEEPGTPAAITAGFYTIKNLGNEQFVNVAGRKTVTFVDETATAPGTVIKVESNENGQVQVLRSQGVDLPGYAERAMKYVPKVVQLVAEKLGAEGEGNLLGKDGLDAIMKKFNESFDYHLYTEQGEQGVRIYGKTPSMQPVVDFYAENKANVDAKLPMLEDFINSAIRKVLDMTSGSGASILTEFSLHEIWEKMGKTLAEPTDDASELLFLQQVLSNKTNVWDFAYQTAMKYWKPLINHKKVQQKLSELGDLAQYVEKIEYIRPDVKYYIVQKDGKIDFISQDNTLLKEASSEWELAARETFTVNFDEQNVQKEKYYTTLYTDFAYKLPEGVKAMTVAKVAELNGKNIAITETIEGAVPAQTPVLLESTTAGDVELTLVVTDGTAIENLLKGNDWLVDELPITTPQVDKLFGIVHDLLEYENMGSLYDRYVKEYEYLKKRNAGTVNNKYFFGLSGDDIAEATMNICQFTKDEQGLAFSHNLEQSAANKAFLPGDKDPVYLSFVGDVDRDGDVDKDDLSALIKIILGTDTEEDNYDHDAANVNEDENENPDIADVTALVNILK